VNADLPDDIGPSEPQLDQLLGLLTSGATADELTGQSAVAAMFRHNVQPAPAPAPAGDPTQHLPTQHLPAQRFPAQRFPAQRARSPRGPRRPARRIRLAAAITVAAVGGFAAAAYAEALPTPVQHVAYRVLGFAGVPDVQPSPGTQAGPGPGAARSARTHRAAPTTSATPRSTTPAARPTSPSASSPVTATGPASLAVTIARSPITAGTSEEFTGRLSGRGQALAGVHLSLLERPAGRTTWHLAGDLTTGSGGRAAVTVADLTTNARFRLTGPDGARSQPVAVIVVPPVSASLASGPRQRADLLTVSSPLAARGGMVVLQVQTAGGWRSGRAKRLNAGEQARFVVKLRGRARAYRVVLLATASHGRALSDPVTVPARPLS
jgi:hypothetical protein